MSVVSIVNQAPWTSAVQKCPEMALLTEDTIQEVQDAAACFSLKFTKWP